MSFPPRSTDLPARHDVRRRLAAARAKLARMGERPGVPERAPMETKGRIACSVCHHFKDDPDFKHDGRGTHQCPGACPSLATCPHPGGVNDSYHKLRHKREYHEREVCAYEEALKEDGADTTDPASPTDKVILRAFSL